MSRIDLLAIAQRVSRDRRQMAILLLATFALAVVGYFVLRHDDEQLRLRTCLSYGRSTPGPLAHYLVQESAKHGLTLECVRATGSESTLDALKRNQLDVALIRAGVAREEPEIRQVANGVCEVLHVFARGNVTAATPEQFRGRRLSIGRPGSETRMFTEAVLSYMGLRANVDYYAVGLQAEECTQLPAHQLPDVVFDVSPLPSPRGEIFARRQGYRLLDLPLGDALRLRDRAYQEILVPACTYSVSPAVPDRELRTIGCRVVLVGRRDVSAAAVKRLLTVIFESDFARRAGLPPIESERMAEMLDCPLHDGALAYIERDRPLIRAEMLENLQGLQGIIGTSTCGILLAWGWYRRMRIPGVARYPQLLAEIELEALRLSGEQGLRGPEFRQFWQQLATLRAEVLGHVAAGRLSADNKFSELLQRFAMVEQSLERLSERHVLRLNEASVDRRAA